MNRREFLRDVLLWSAGLSLAAPRFTVSTVLAAPDPSPLVAVGTGADYVKLTAAVFEGLGGMGKFVRHGDRVVVKPNIGWDRAPDQAANTHPLVVRAVIDQALAAGASSVRDRRVRIEHLDERKFVPVDIARGKAVSRLEIYRDALEADCYINVPVAKHHGLSRLTLGLKNSMGVLGGNRGRMHHDLGQKLADLATVLRPALNIIDATRILLRNGPQGGSLADVKTIDTIIASADPVAADAWATTLFGLEPGDIESTVAAHAMGLGEMNIDAMQLRTVTA